MKLNCEKRDAVRIKVELSGDVNKYAKSFLAIYNNVKNDSQLLKMYNDYGNNVYLICETEIQDAAVKFLEQFGTIVSINPVEVVQPQGLEYKYRDDIDTEFLEVAEY